MPLKLATRARARKRGNLTYRGTPCALGHTRRYLAGGNCVVCTKARVNEWKRKRRADTRTYRQYLERQGLKIVGRSDRGIMVERAPRNEEDRAAFAEYKAKHKRRIAKRGY